MTAQAHLEVAGLNGATVALVHGREAMNELSRFEVELISKDWEVDIDALVDEQATLAIADEAGTLTHFHLVVLQARRAGHHRDDARYRLVLGPPQARLTLRVNHCIFQEKSTQQIVAEVLQKAGVPSASIKWRLGGQYALRTYTVQYGESDWEFIARLLADDGINVWSDYDGENTSIVFGDGTASHESLVGDGAIVPFQDASGLQARGFAFHTLERTWKITPTKASVRDVDVYNPTVAVDGSAGDGALEHFEYPSNLTVADAAQARAQVRLQQLRRHVTTLTAASHNARMRAGRVVEIAGAADDHHSGKFIIVAVEHELSEGGVDRGGAPYSNRVTLVPFDETAPHRPNLPKLRAVDALENGTVTGPGGEEIHVDDLGRVKLRFLWDRSKIGDDKSSRWVRTLQPNVPAPQILPRVGWEVPVVYEHGDPDRPFVLGRLYNGGAPPPYGLPGKKATSTLQSATSPSDGTTHELRFADDAGSEEAFIHATKDHTVSVGGPHEVTVTANRSDDVVKSHRLQIDATQTVTVGGNQKITVGANGTIAIRGARSETVLGNETRGVTGTYQLQSVGAYIELVGGFYSLRCNQANATIQGAFTQVVGAALAVTAGLGANQSVTGARTEVVGGARTFTAGLTYADGTTGSKKINAGLAKESANVDLDFKAGARETLQAAGAMTISGKGKVLFEAKSISVKAAKLVAEGGSKMTLSGTMKSSTTIHCDAPKTKKTDKMKVEG